jgi:hypothetical protein
VKGYSWKDVVGWWTISWSVEAISVSGIAIRFVDRHLFFALQLARLTSCIFGPTNHFNHLKRPKVPFVLIFGAISSLSTLQPDLYAKHGHENVGGLCQPLNMLLPGDLSYHAVLGMRPTYKSFPARVELSLQPERL